MCHDPGREFSDWEELIREAAGAVHDEDREPPERDLAPPPVETADVGEPELGRHELDEPELD